MFKKLLSVAVIICFFLTTLGPLPRAHADAPLNLPAPGTMIDLSPAYQPVMIKGLTVHKDNPFLFDFIVDAGQDRASGQALKTEGEKLIKYFLASLAIPEKDLWVNLSPYEKDRMIPEALGQTDMGRDLLEQDYILKQITASLIYPEKNLGKKFWDKVYSKAQSMYGTTQIPVNTFNKVWIMADKAEVFERNQTAFVTGSHLKVMLEEDYLSLKEHSGIQTISTNANQAHSISSQIVRDIILPELEHEVNTGKNFANLRQVFNSMILASWYKINLKQALINQFYADKSKVKGINLSDPTIKEQIYQQYLKAYKKGVFNYIKTDINEANGQVVPRKYFSGGIILKAHPAMTANIQALRLLLAASVAFFIFNATAIFNQGAVLPSAPPSSLQVDAAMNAKITKDMPWLKEALESPLAIPQEVFNANNKEFNHRFKYEYYRSAEALSYLRGLRPSLQYMDEIKWQHDQMLDREAVILNQQGHVMQLRTAQNIKDFVPAVHVFTDKETGGLYVVIVQDRGEIYQQMVPTLEKYAKVSTGTGPAYEFEYQLTEPALGNIVLTMNYDDTTGEDVTATIDHIRGLVTSELSAAIPGYHVQKGGDITPVTLLGADESRANVEFRKGITRYKAEIHITEPGMRPGVSAAMNAKIEKDMPLLKWALVSPIAIPQELLNGNKGVNHRFKYEYYRSAEALSYLRGLRPSLKYIDEIKWQHDQMLDREAVILNEQGHVMQLRTAQNIKDFVPAVHVFTDKETGGLYVVIVHDRNEVYQQMASTLAKYARVNTGHGPSLEFEYEFTEPTLGNLVLTMNYDDTTGEDVTATIDHIRGLVTSELSAALPGHHVQNGPEIRTVSLLGADESRANVALRKGITRYKAEIHITDAAMGRYNGGIDLAASGMNWKVSKDGKGVEMTVDPAMIQKFRRDGINSLSAFVYKITPVANIWPLVGLKG